MGIHAGIYMAAAILSAPVLTAGGGQNTAAATNVSFEAPQESGSGGQEPRCIPLCASGRSPGTGDRGRNRRKWLQCLCL